MGTNFCLAHLSFLRITQDPEEPEYFARMCTRYVISILYKQKNGTLIKYRLQLTYCILKLKFIPLSTLVIITFPKKLNGR